MANIHKTTNRPPKAPSIPSEARRKEKLDKNFTCENILREQITKNIRAKADAMGREPDGGDVMIANWVRFACEKAAADGRLLSNRQYQDWMMGRHLKVGDRARYIGENRTEISQDGSTSIRPKGQVGVISAIDQVDGAEIATFFPHDPVFVTTPGGESVQKIVNMVVRVDTKEWRDLERA